MRLTLPKDATAADMVDVLSMTRDRPYVVRPDGLLLSRDLMDDGRVYRFTDAKGRSLEASKDPAGGIRLNVLRPCYECAAVMAVAALLCVLAGYLAAKGMTWEIVPVVVR